MRTIALAAAMAASMLVSGSAVAGGLIVHWPGGEVTSYTGHVVYYDPDPGADNLSGASFVEDSAAEVYESDAIFESPFGSAPTDWRWRVVKEVGGHATGAGYCASSFDGQLLELTCIPYPDD